MYRKILVATGGSPWSEAAVAYAIALAARLDAEIERVSKAVETAVDKASGAKIRDLRDMLTLLRHRQLKPDKGRRKDLKKIESVVNDLAMLIENW